MDKKHASLILLLCLIIFWVILSTRIDVTSLTIGLMATLLVLFYNMDLMFRDSEITKLTLKKLWLLMVLTYHLFINIFKSNIEVAKIVLSKEMHIKPGFKTIKQPLKKELNQALFGNAITLTPGTLTVDMNNQEIIVHALNVDSIDEISKSSVLKAFVLFEGDEV